MTTTNLLAVPEEFIRPSNLVFQSASKWSSAEADGVMVIGTYEGRTEPDSYGKENHSFVATRDGVSYDADGNEVPFSAGAKIIINSSASLDRGLTEDKVGAELCIVYNGKNKLTKGPNKGKEAHSFSILTKNS